MHDSIYIKSRKCKVSYSYRKHTSGSWRLVGVSGWGETGLHRSTGKHLKVKDNVCYLDCGKSFMCV